ncbi:hypothetical protein KFE98_09295 [bacterium SCSIO 12741]|nr:hypothetical protein KFE98_09295 [bacterium SCSIO 12741]
MIRWVTVSFCFFLTLFSFHGLAQNRVNDWIDFQQQYLKIPVSSQGIHRIDYQTLNDGMADMGVSLSSIDPRNLQLFVRGEEQFIYIDGESDGRFDPGDELLFYGEGNDGWFDTSLYINPQAQPNPYYSLINDTQWYYLTWNSQLTNMRFQTETNTHFTGKTAATYVWKEATRLSTTSYNQGHKDASGVSSPLYGPGEGWIYPPRTTTYSIYITTRNALTTAISPDATARIVTLGTNNPAVIPNHHLRLHYGRTLSTLNLVKDTMYTGYVMLRHNFKVPATNMANDVWIQLESPRIDPSLPNSQALGYIYFKFAHSPSLGGESTFPFRLPQNVDTTYVRFTNYNHSSSYVYDLEKGVRSLIVKTGNQIEMLLPPGNERNCFLAPDNTIQDVVELQPLSNYRRGKGYFTDYQSLSPDSAFLIVTHSGLYSSANQYASYRQSQGMQTSLELVEELYDQFSYGIQKHPAAVRNFVAFTNQVWSKPPSYLFLIGKSVKEVQTRKSNVNRAKNKVPTIGFPASDNLFTSSMKGNDYTPSIPVGRLAAVDNNQVLDYLNKIKEFEQAAQWKDPGIAEENWKKRGIHVAGGENESQQSTFKAYLKNYQNDWERVSQSGKIFNFQRFISGSVQDQEFDSLRILINDGVTLLSFFGHGSGGQLGVNLGNPEDYENRGKYPLFIANSCNVGDYHLPNENSLTINERWVLAPRAGAIAFIASTSLGFPYNLDRWSQSFYQELTRDNYGGSIGEHMQKTIRQIQNTSSDINDRSNRTCMEITLHGIPLWSSIHMKYLTLPLNARM